MRIIAALLASLLASGCVSIPAGTPEVSARELAADPSKYEGQLVVVRGYVSYGFENCMIDGQIWYWPRHRSCYAPESHFDAWSDSGYVLGVVSVKDHGHLGAFPFSLVQARAVRQR